MTPSVPTHSLVRGGHRYEEQHMDLGLNGKRAIVTGGSRGIGRAIARSLAAGGGYVLAARNAETLATAASALEQETGRRVIGIPTDTGDDAAVAKWSNGRSPNSVVSTSSSTPPRRPGAQTSRRRCRTTNEQFWSEMNIKVLGYLRTARAVART